MLFWAPGYPSTITIMISLPYTSFIRYNIPLLPHFSNYKAAGQRPGNIRMRCTDLCTPTTQHSPSLVPRPSHSAGVACSMKSQWRGPGSISRVLPVTNAGCMGTSQEQSYHFPGLTCLFLVLGGDDHFTAAISSARVPRSISRSTSISVSQETGSLPRPAIHSCRTFVVICSELSLHS